METSHTTTDSTLVTVVRNYLHTCACCRISSHGYYLRSAFISLRASKCTAATIQRDMVHLYPWILNYCHTHTHTHTHTQLQFPNAQSSVRTSLSTSDSDSSPHTSAVVVDNPLGRDTTKNGWTDPEMSLRIVTKEIGTHVCADWTYPVAVLIG